MVQAIDTWLVEKFKQYVSNDSSIFYYMHEYWENGVDQRTKGYFMVDMSFLSAALVEFLYLFTIFVFIPGIMSGRKPLKMTKLILVYNCFMVIMNAYFFFKVLFKITRFGRDLWDFSNPKYDVSEKAMDFIDTAHLYYLSKMVDYFDTFFMCFKKKRNQITFLHVWHHITMVFAGWMFMRYNPYMPTCAIIPIVNGFIHMMMYSYYALSSLGPNYQKYLWWKKYLTKIQIYQFYIHLTWYTIIFFKHDGMPLGYIYCNWGNGFAFLLLFVNHYLQSYLDKDIAIASLRQAILAVANSCHPELTTISKENGYETDTPKSRSHQE